MEKRRVVITGIRAICPVGNTAHDAWNAVVEGRSGIGPLTKVTIEDVPVKIAGEIKNFNSEAYLPPKEARRMDDFIKYGVSAGIQAWRDAGFNDTNHGLDPERIGVVIGTGIGGLLGIRDTVLSYKEKGYRRISPFFIPGSIPNLAAGNLSIFINAKGPNLCIATACAAGSHSIGESYHMIKRDDADLMVAGAADSILCDVGIGGFSIMHALSSRNDAPEKASRPFDVNRDGFVISEGAAVVVLEEYEHARKRNANIYAEIIGYGASGDAFHITTPAEDGSGAINCMSRAVKGAGIPKEEIAYVNAHGTSTPTGDVLEAKAIAKFFGLDAVRNINVSSTKSCTGHLLGAAGSLETIFTALAVKNDVVPPTINLDNLDPVLTEFNMNFTPKEAQKRRINVALNNSFGFGGTNACLVLKKL